MNTEIRRVVWFSYGAASAVAAKIAIEKYGSLGCHIVHCDTLADEHEDNARFLQDFEKWLDVKVTTIGSDKYKTTTEVFEARKYMSGVKGASCTVELKKKPRFAYQKPDDVHVFGLTADEKKRIKTFEANNHELFLWWPLLEFGLTKSDCLEVITHAGIALPAMYKLGYNNNNCKGCVKATSPSYWNKIRKDFPDVFASRAEQSRRLKCKLTRVKGKRIYLDELSPDCEEVIKEDLSCGPQCRGQK